MEIGKASFHPSSSRTDPRLTMRPASHHSNLTMADFLNPYNAIFSHDLIKDEEPAVYYSKLVEELRRTFALAREAQLKTAMRNEAPVEGSKFRPDFSPGDEVYVWKKSSKESRLQEEDREAGRDKPGDRHVDNMTRGEASRPNSNTSGMTPVPLSDGDAICTASSRGKVVRPAFMSTD